MHLTDETISLFRHRSRSIEFHRCLPGWRSLSGLAGWRRERLPTLPSDAYLTLAPDWVCEILSPSTEALDRGKKLHRYAREGVAHAWLIEPLRQTLEALVLVSGKWERHALHEGRGRVRAPPFDRIELELGSLWI